MSGLQFIYHMYRLSKIVPPKREILAFEGDSRIVWFEGNYQEYEEDRHRRLGAADDVPRRIKYKKLVRG